MSRYRDLSLANYTHKQTNEKPPYTYIHIYIYIYIYVHVFLLQSSKRVDESGLKTLSKIGAHREPTINDKISQGIKSENRDTWYKTLKVAIAITK
jgi:hypothetical protein